MRTWPVTVSSASLARRVKAPGGRFAVLTVAAAATVALTAAGCGSSGGTTGAQVSASAKQTIVFATQGLGGEGTATNTAVAAFEKLHPNIKVQILNLSPTSDVAFEQLTQRFTAGATTPDVITSDVIWPAQFAQSGWLANLSKFKPDTGAYFPAQMATGQYKGGVYAIPWFINAEGLYYRTDLIKTPPTTTAQLFSEALAAMKTDHSLKEGLAFEGDKYEGAVTAFQSMGGQIGTSDLGNIDTSANTQVLTMMSNAIKQGVAPSAVTTWEEGQVQAAWLSGQTPFALNWPYIFALSDGKGCQPGCNPVFNKTGWVPFPNANGSPQASLGGDDLAVNARSTHQAAAWEFIQYLSSDAAQIARAISAGDPPSVKSAYGSQLYAAAPYFQQEQAVYAAATPRPVTPVYTQISSQLQTMISSVLTGGSSPSSALSTAAPTVKQLLSTVSSGG